MNQPHILIVGNPGVGKSTLIRRLLEHNSRPVCGFVTKMEPSEVNGLRSIYVHPAAQPEHAWEYTGENLIGTCDTKIHNINLDAFDTLGVEYLSALPQNGLILMDELGFMEAGSVPFTQRVLEVLDGDIPVLAAVKSRTDIPFLEQVRSHPKATVCHITPENREELFHRLLPIIQSIWEE